MFLPIGGNSTLFFSSAACGEVAPPGQELGEDALPRATRCIPRNRFFAFVLVGIVGVFSTPARLSAQAWVPSRGEGTLGLSVQASQFDGHLLSDGSKVEVGSSSARTLALEIDYGITDRLALKAAVPYVLTRNGPDPSPVAGRNGIDDGHVHGTWQDYRFSLRYKVLTDPVVLTPFARLVLPSHHYETRAEAAPGRDLSQLIVGAHIGRILFPYTHPSYLHATLSYAFVEELNGVSTDRLDIALTYGYLLTPRLTLNLLGTLRDTYGGLTIDYVIFSGEATEDEFLEHDRLLAEDLARLGLGGSFALNRNWSFNAAWLTVVSGSDTHYGNTYILGVQRSFGASARSDG